MPKPYVRPSWYPEPPKNRKYNKKNGMCRAPNCTKIIPVTFGRGRIAWYCSPACRQRAYKARRKEREKKEQYMADKPKRQRKLAEQEFGP